MGRSENYRSYSYRTVRDAPYGAKEGKGYRARVEVEVMGRWALRIIGPFDNLSVGVINHLWSDKNGLDNKGKGNLSGKVQGTRYYRS